MTEPTIAAENETALVSPSDVVTILGENMPDVTENHAERVAAENEPTPENLRDAKGQKFSPDRHSMGADGKPLTGKNGAFKLKKEYRDRYVKGDKPKSFPPAEKKEAPISPASFNEPEKPVDPNLQNRQDEYDFAAEVYLQSAYGPVIIAFSEHARPDAEDHSALKTALANYLRVKQISEPSPGWALTFVAVAVAVKKSSHPVVMERAKSFTEKLKGFFSPKKSQIK